jgi:hypothetical protein
MNRRLTALSLSAIAMLGLTACSGGGGAESQTVDEACAAVSDTINTAFTDFTGVSAAEPEEAADAFQSAADAVGDAGDDVTNAEVAELLPDIEAVFSTAAEAMTAVAEGDQARAAELQDVATDMQASLTRFQELCLS